MSAAGRRILGSVIAAAIVCVAIGLYIGLYLINVPGSVAAAQTPTGAQLYLATVPAAEVSDPHPTWVSYYAVRRQRRQLAPRHHVRGAGQHAGARRRSTSSTAPRALRNPFIGQAAGTVGGVMTLDGKPTQRDRSRQRLARLRDPADRPLGPARRAWPKNAKNPCGNAPCSLSQRPRHDHLHVPHARPRGSTAGSASCRARPDSSRASAGRCRRSATWTASSRSYERAGEALSMDGHAIGATSCCCGCWRA